MNIQDAIRAATKVVAAQHDNSLTAAQAPALAAAIAEQMPEPKALESLWPQLARYAVTIVGSFLVGRGVVAESEWPIIAGGILALAPPLYRTISTWVARRAKAA